MNRNLLYAIVGTLAVATAVFAYQAYETSQEPSGVQINLGEEGLSITNKK